jgi:Tol biopolymer transport system component
MRLRAADGAIYLAAALDGGKTIAVRALESRDDWRKLALVERLQGRPAVAGEFLVVPCADGRIYRLRLDGRPSGLANEQTFRWSHETDPGPQKPLDFSKGYVWMINPAYAMYKTRPDGSQLTKLIDKNAYVAETTIAPNGKYMVWTSTFEGDLEIYRSDLNGGNIKRLTNEVGYDGGPFISWDSKKIVYRRQPENTPQEIKDYKALLGQNLVRPTSLEIWVMDADGSNKRQVTHLNCASFAPFMMPDEKRIIFSSNYGDPAGREFDLYVINIDGTGLEKITTSPEFDGFPMFTRDGKKLAFASNRNGKVKGETNLFVADWAN